MEAQNELVGSHCNRFEFNFLPQNCATKALFCYVLAGSEGELTLCVMELYGSYISS